MHKKGMGKIIIPIVAVLALLIVGGIAAKAFIGHTNGDVDNFYCDDGDVYNNGNLALDCIDGVEECALIDTVAQCVPIGTGGDTGGGEDGTIDSNKNTRCSDGIDNDNDGYTDCDDYDCSQDTTGVITVCEDTGGDTGGGDTQTYCYLKSEGYYCKENWGDVYKDSQEAQNCWSAYEECKEFTDNGETYVACLNYEEETTCANANAPGDDPGGSSGGGVDEGTNDDPGNIGDGYLSFVPTYENIGITWNPENKDATEVATVQYRETPTLALAGWNDALDLWYDNRGSTEYRGSILKLKSCTSYDIMLTLEPSGETVTKSVQTRCNPPRGEVVQVPSTSATYVINSGGTPDAYKVYNCGGNVIDVQRNYDNAVEVSGSVAYAIIENCQIKNARKHGIYLAEGSHDIVIQDNDISGWSSGANRDAGIKAGGVWDGRQAGYRYTIQRNKIHDPATGSNSWDSGHPGGAQGIDFADSPGQNVIRYNDIYSTNGNKYNDPLGGEHNTGNREGFPGPNSDIYGNYLANCWDDGIEAEGSGENVRIYNNYIDDCNIMIANVDTNVGPLYNVNNVFDSSRRSESDPGKSGLAFKQGDLDGGTPGRIYFLHNTVLQARDGVGAFVHRTDGGLQNAFIANNVAPLRGGNSNAHINPGSGGCNNYADYNLYTGNIWGECANQEQNGIKGTPQWNTATLYNYPNGREFNQKLQSGSPGSGDALPLDNIGRSDMGAGYFCFGVTCNSNAVLSFVANLVR